MSKKVLVTGTSSGFGKLIANTLLEEGHSVVASMRDIEGRNQSEADELRTAGAQVVEINVTNDASAASGVSAVTQAAGGLDVLVNNVGVGVLGLQEAFTPDDWQRLLTPSDADRLSKLGDFAKAPMQMMEEFGENMSGENAPDPQWIADAAAKLVAAPAGQRLFRRVVDGLGMGDLIDPYNQQRQQLTAGIYSAFGMADMLTLKT